MDSETLRKLSPTEQLKYFGMLTQKYLFDSKKFQKATKLLKSQDNEFGAYQIEVGFSEDDFPENYYDLFDIFHEPAFDFELLRIAKLAILEKPVLVKIKGDVSYKEFDEEHLFIHGDLHIEGNLTLNTSLFVTGDLIVNGVIQNPIEWTPFQVGGNIEAKAMDVGGQVYCAGNVKTDCICIDGTGRLHTRNGLTAKFLIKESFEHEIEGNSNVEYLIDFKENYEVTTKKAIAALKEILKPELINPIEKEWKEKGDNFYFPKRLILDAI